MNILDLLLKQRSRDKHPEPTPETKSRNEHPEPTPEANEKECTY